MDWLKEESTPADKLSKRPWKILVVDDAPEIFKVTKLALNAFKFESRGLEFLYAASAEEGRNIFRSHSDIALALVDVVMESEDAGLCLVEYVRSELDNHYTRIVLRTGQPGFAPESDIIRNYDIDGYKSKTELNQQSLTHCFITSLRSYRDLVRIQNFQLGLEALVDSLLSMQSLENFDSLTDSLLLQLRAVLGAYDSEFVIKLRAVDGCFKSDNSTKSFSSTDSNYSEEYALLIKQCIEEKKSLETEDFYAHYFRTEHYESVLLIVGAQNINKYSQRLIALFCQNVCVLLERLMLEKLND